MGTCYSQNERRRSNTSMSTSQNQSNTFTMNYGNSYQNNSIIQNIENNNFKSDKNKNKEEILNIYEKLVKIHNDYRQKHNSPNLVLNIDLCKLAQEYADKYADFENIDFCPNLYKDEPIGENISEFKGDFNINEENPFLDEIFKNWYDESKNYNFNQKKYMTETRHFTQIIWKSSNSIGFGFSKLANGKNFFVAYYHPAGNIFNQFEENIQKKI